MYKGKLQKPEHLVLSWLLFYYIFIEIILCESYGIKIADYYFFFAGASIVFLGIYATPSNINTANTIR